MGYAGRNNIYEATIKRMVTQALEAQEQAFQLAHAADTEEQLVAYLRQCAAALRHTPWPGEIVGGTLIEQRLGSWEKALAAANLTRPVTPNHLTSFVRYREERAKQETIYRQKKAAKKLRAQQRNQTPK